MSEQAISEQAIFAKTNEIPAWISNSSYLQVSHQTAKNRFPKVFETVKKFRGDAERILSFGCSTGEECESISSYFPMAKEIVGIDIDFNSINLARSRNKDPRVFFHTDIGATGKYDLVFCMMVLFCIDYPVPFEKFEKTVKLIDSHVNQNGVVVFYSCQFDPTSVQEIKDNYKVIRSWTRVHNRDKKEYFCGYYIKR
jgi:2-polyprenyl-3-methyl-5-hydroxy-6-metoxy-1,4-benzoquinol methylase